MEITVITSNLIRRLKDLITPKVSADSGTHIDFFTPCRLLRPSVESHRI
jgi:hypothetical protein